LISVTNLSATPQNINNVFPDVDLGKCLLEVPASAVNAYKAAPVWSEFGGIVDMQATVVWEVEGNWEVEGTFAEDCVGVFYFWGKSPALYYKYILLKPGVLRIEFEDSHIHTFLHDREPGYFAKTNLTEPFTFADQPTVPTNGGGGLMAYGTVMERDLNGKSGNVLPLCPRSTPQDISFHLNAGTYWSTHTLELNIPEDDPNCGTSDQDTRLGGFPAATEDFVLKVTFTPDE
jgi:hypothetical protein